MKRHLWATMFTVILAIVSIGADAPATQPIDGARQQLDPVAADARAPHPALAKTFPMEIRFARVPASKALDWLGEVVRDSSGGNLYVHAQALRHAGIDNARPITLDVQPHGQPLSWILTEILKQMSTDKATAAFSSDADIIYVSTPDGLQTIAQTVDQIAKTPELDRPSPEMRISEIAFKDVIDFYRDVTRTNLYIAWDEFKGAGIEPTAPISFRLRDVRCGKVLAMILVDAGAVPVRFSVDENKGKGGGKVIMVSPAKKPDH